MTDRITLFQTKDGKMVGVEASSTPSVGDKVALVQTCQNCSAHQSRTPSTGDKVVLLYDNSGKQIAIARGGTKCLVFPPRFVLTYGSTKVNPYHIFTSESARDLYFTTCPAQLVEDTYVGVIKESQQYIQKYNGSYWIDDEGPLTYTLTRRYPDVLHQCGYEYSGYVSLLFFMTYPYSYPECVVEVRKCRQSDRRIVFETYGSTTASLPISIWFNQSTDRAVVSETEVVKASTKNCVLLNSAEKDATMTYLLTSMVFTEPFPESERFVEEYCELQYMVIASCCSTCDDLCTCLLCDRRSKFRVTCGTTVTYGDTVPNYGAKYYFGTNCLVFDQIIVEYTFSLTGESVDIWVYFDADLNESDTVLVEYTDEETITEDTVWNPLYSGVSGLLVVNEDDL